MSQGFVNPQPITLPVPVADGGTGTTGATAYAVQCGGTTSTGAHQSIASVGTSGQVLTSNGAGALPTFQAVAGANGDVKAWVNFDGTTSPGTIRASSNVTSVTRNSTGDYTVNITNAIVDANYAVSIATGAGSASASTAWGFQAAPTTTAFRFATGNSSSGGNTNYAYISCTIVR